MSAQSRAEFIANWDRQVGCPDQYDPAVSDVVWSEMLASDPVGATWGTGVRRAPLVPTWGFNQAVVSKMETPFLMVAGRARQAGRARAGARALRGLGGQQKILIDLACSSHNAMWEKNRLQLFRASREWLLEGNVQGKSAGELRLGY